MKKVALTVATFFALFCTLASLGNVRGGEPPGPDHSWTFDGEPIEKAPRGFSFGLTGDGKPGRWVVRAATDAPSAAGVLAQVDMDDTNYRFPVAVAAAPDLKDLSLSVKCKATEGKVDQACGLVFRYRNESNYYVVRTNALENNVRLYYVKDGRRVQIAGWNGKVAKNAWHALSVEARGDQFVVRFDGKNIINARDQTFLGPGKIGVWTKADSVTLFDDLVAVPLK